jgi:hypothetical protein
MSYYFRRRGGNYPHHRIDAGGGDEFAKEEFIDNN